MSVGVEGRHTRRVPLLLAFPPALDRKPLLLTFLPSTETSSFSGCHRQCHGSSYRRSLASCQLEVDMCVNPNPELLFLGEVEAQFTQWNIKFILFSFPQSGSSLSRPCLYPS